ncbi:MAG: cytidylate kinase-like family protein [Dysgonamonadaceae bacterium]|jgi:cytidylate kinase|nr:cytidylate kinase-like family protein [Dysgonamonadaceae bacterium]
MKTNYVITIGRQLGSGGKQIGELLSRKLGIPCYDKELILIASRESGLGKEFFEKFDEKNSFSFFSNIFTPHSGNYLCNETLFGIQSDVIKKLAEKESCIFVGRCADYILRNHPRLLSIFIHANFNDRIGRIIAKKNCTEKDAKSLLEQTDRKRAEYYNYYSNKLWGMSTSYDLCVNSSVLGIEETTEFLYRYASIRIRN